VLHLHVSLRCFTSSGSCNLLCALYIFEQVRLRPTCCLSLHVNFNCLTGSCISSLIGYNPVWGGHSCIDCLLSMRILLPTTNTRENNLTSFIIFCRGNLLRAKLWTVIQCTGHDGKLQPHRVNVLPGCGIWLVGGKGANVIMNNW